MILKERNKIVMQNPGSIRTGKKQMLRGGISDPRNKAIMKMFNMISIGERAGSGVPNIYSVWEDKGWEKPDVEEQYGPDRTILTLSFEKNKTSSGGINGGLSGGINGGLNEDLANEIIEVITDNNYITILGISEKLNIPKRTVEREMKKMRDLGRIVRQGSKKKGYWEVH